MLKVNDREMKWQQGMTVEDAIRFAEYPEYNYPILVVTLNGVHVKNDTFNTTPISDGDVIKIMQP
ncbi:MAG: MoaD/ThiS family protein, partial [Clostridiales bacterium]|nr:MoaD/ThiS family protein [Clostridiales bacterium]